MITGISADIPTADHLRRIRKDIGISQAELAQAIGLSKQTTVVHEWEAGMTKPTKTQWAAVRFLYAAVLLESGDDRAADLIPKFVFATEEKGTD